MQNEKKNTEMRKAASMKRILSVGHSRTMLLRATADDASARVIPEFLR